MAFRLRILLGVFLSLTVGGDASDVASLSPEAVLPDGARVMNVGTGREPPVALEATTEFKDGEWNGGFKSGRKEGLDHDGAILDSQMPDGPLGPAQEYEGGGRRAASYDWEDAYDIYSPLLFNWKFYAAKYELGNTSSCATCVTEAAVRADWKNHVENGEKFPDCRQGQPLFSANQYFKNNPEINTNLEGSCSGALRSFVSQGVMEGASGSTGRIARTTESKTEVKIKKGAEIPAEFIDPSEQYTLAFWLNFEAAGGGDYRSILRYGDSEAPYPKSPAVLQHPSSLDEPNTRLSVIVSHTNNPDFGCDPEPHIPVRKWTYVAVAVGTNSVKVFYDGKEVCHEQSDTGSTLVPNNMHMLVGDQFHSAAFAKIDKMTYYKSEVMNSGMLKAIMQIDPPLDDKDDKDAEELLSSLL
jgi:hypothetical protein